MEKRNAMEGLDQSGIDHEIAFWKRFVFSHRFLNDWCSNEKTNELHQEVYDFIKQQPSNSMVLDVGSGPVSILRGTVPNEFLTACDPLSLLYKEIFDFKTAGINPPFDHACEELPEEWREQFDIVHISNALDHCKSPYEAHKNLLNCVKRNGYLIIQGHEDEAEHENWSGFHQYNLSLTDEGAIKVMAKDPGDSFTIYNHGNEQVLSQRYKLNTGRNWFIWIIRKS